MDDYNHSFLKKQKVLIDDFARCCTPEERYNKIIEFGQKLPSFPEAFKTPDNVVSGCQSTMYLNADLVNGKVHLTAYSDALISAGLAALLIAVYNDESAEVILKCPPLFLQELGIVASLTPSRSNGLASLYLTIKRKALNFLVLSQQS